MSYDSTLLPVKYKMKPAIWKRCLYVEKPETSTPHRAAVPYSSYPDWPASRGFMTKQSPASKV